MRGFCHSEIALIFVPSACAHTVRQGWGLPASYPRHADGAPVTWEECRPVGEAAHGAGLDGVACRSPADGARRDDHELAYFERDNAPALEPAGEPLAFDDWVLGCRLSVSRCAGERSSPS